jgi:hypothetical protein
VKHVSLGVKHSSVVKLWLSLFHPHEHYPAAQLDTPPETSLKAASLRGQKVVSLLPAEPVSGTPNYWKGLPTCVQDQTSPEDGANRRLAPG